MKSEQHIRKILEHHKETVAKVKRGEIELVISGYPHRTMAIEEMEAMIQAFEWVLE